MPVQTVALYDEGLSKIQILIWLFYRTLVKKECLNRKTYSSTYWYFVYRCLNIIVTAVRKHFPEIYERIISKIKITPIFCYRKPSKSLRCTLPSRWIIHMYTYIHMLSIILKLRRQKFQNCCLYFLYGFGHISNKSCCWLILLILCNRYIYRHVEWFRMV